jgi:hypothetical protein
MDTIKKLDKIIKYEEQNIKTLKSERKKRLLALFYFSLLAPYFISLKFFIALSFIFPTINKQLKAWYIKYYYNTLFYFKGLIIHLVNPIPTKTTGPTIIFGLRRDEISNIATYCLFSKPIIIPTSAKQLKLNPFLKPVSYPDKNLNQNLENIENLINAGYPTLVYINHHKVDPLNIRSISFYQSITKLLKKDINIYFLNLENISRYPFSSLYNPTIVSANLQNIDDLLKNTDRTNTQQTLQKIAEFYSFLSYDLLD